VDAGIRHYVDLNGAIERCLELVDDEKHITIDAIILDREGLD